MDEHTSHELAYKKGYEDGKPKWIPVTERLPETTRLCIVSKYNVPFLAWYTGKDWRFTATATVVDGVTHWMELPTPPKGE